MPAPPDARVWLVEDEPAFRETFAYLVEHAAGMRCARTFGRAEDALAALADGATDGADDGDGPDLLLLDVNLPGRSGIELAAEAKALRPEARIVMLTIRDDAETIFAALRAGASGYLLKNSPIDGIIAGLQEALDGGMLMPAPVARKVLGFFADAPVAGGSAEDYGLTEREGEVLSLMVEGLIQKEIADQLCVSPSTVNGHVQRIYGKLHVRSGRAAVAKALRERLV